jgi:CSLREA domain-containing protein
MLVKPRLLFSAGRYFLLLVMLLGTVCAAQAMTFTVTKTADTNDGSCDADCSLREAIIAANNNPGQDTIAFNIGSGAQTISPTSVLPNITESVIIDGTTQPGFAGNPLIEIDGTNAGTNVFGLTVGGDHCTVKGLVINRFKGGYGIFVSGTGNHTISGNYIGLDLTGTVAQGNFTGIGISSANNIIGGTTAAERNVISGNDFNSGIGISGPAATDNLIEGNYIGTDVTGTISLGNAIGIYVIQSCSNNTIGGATPGARNLISGNGASGITIETTGNKVQGNYIGTKADGTSALGNPYGVNLLSASHDNVIGGTGAGEGNVIAFNNGYGVLAAKGSLHNGILGNSIFSNQQLGIDLGGDGVTPNDALDVDTGAQTANEFQNYPAITTITPNGANTDISGSLNSLANTQFRLEFFSNTAADATGFGEGQKYLGFTNVTTNGSGDVASFTFTVPTASIAGNFLTATATDPLNNTSEFSQVKAAGSAGTLQFSAATYSVNENGGTATITVTRTGGTNGLVTVNYATANGTATAGQDYTSASGLLSWGNGISASQTFTIPITDDSLDEPDETVSITLSNATGGATIGNPASAVLTITDNDPAPSLSINDVSQAEGNSGTTNFNFTVTLSAASGQTVSVNYATANGTAQAGSDYLSVNGLLTFTPGQTSKPVTVQVNGDTQFEPNETFFVNLSNATNATIGKSQGTGTIVNDDAVPPPTVQFSQASTTVQEDLTAITVTVTRSGDTSGASSVEYQSVDGTATQKGDFEYAAGTLNFAAGDTSKSFQVLINEDMFAEGPENFSVALSNPAGATLGAPATMTVNITDDSPESFSNPIDDAQSFVYMQYHDFLNREPDAAGLSFWTNQITSCGADQSCISNKRVNVSGAFFLSIEFQETGFLVERLYKASYGNIAGTPVPLTLNEFVSDARAISAGVIVNQAGWQQQLDANKQTFLTGFVQRTRFLNAHPTSLTPAQFVDALFANAGVVPTAAQRQAVINRFAGAGNTTDVAARVAAVLDVLQNASFIQAETSRAFVLMEYFGYLRRNPNDAPELGLNFDGYNFWLQKLISFGGNFQDAEMVKAFLAAAEYRQRFGQ